MLKFYGTSREDLIGSFAGVGETKSSRGTARLIKKILLVRETDSLGISTYASLNSDFI